MVGDGEPPLVGDGEPPLVGDGEPPLARDGATRPRLREVVRRGLGRLCPRCGAGRLFEGFLRVRQRCEVCGLALAARRGDTWGFWVLGDRLFVVVPVVLIYFGVTPLSLLWRAAFMIAVLIPLVWTMPHRLGVCIGLDYLTRVRWGDWEEPASKSPPS